ncbi:MAG: pyruvate, phosphate dikinase [Actinomycetota bacterium]|nr:pyruvate, phosphate dikinase [Actinomycetota bacterium]
MPRYVYDFSEGSRDLVDLLGGKGANLAEMTRLGLPVPPGFTITTEACRHYLREQRDPPELAGQLPEALAALERRAGKQLGAPTDPLLVSVRSGSKFSMPGMMDTVLDIGLNDRSVLGLARQSGNAQFAWDSYRRLLQMFGRTVLGVAGELFEDALEKAKLDAGAAEDVDLGEESLRRLVDEYGQLIMDASGRPFPQDPHEQLLLAVHAVFASWNSPRAVVYRRAEGIPGDLGTAVNVCAMVFGNLGHHSGTGVAFTRDPSTGRRGTYGDYLPSAQGEDVVAGIRNALPLAELEHLNPTAYRELLGHMSTLERHYRDLCDIEFTIERGRLWMLQTRVGKRTPAAAFRIAVQLVDEGVIDLDEALRRVTGAQLTSLMFPRFDGAGVRRRLARGVAASPGAAVGVAVFDSAQAVARAAAGESVVLVRRETNPDDLAGMIAAAGVLTSRGGKTSHAAVVARGMGRTCVCGAEGLIVDAVARRFTTSDGTVVAEGEVISLDGSTGEVFLGAVPVTPSPVVRYFEGTLDPASPDTDEVVAAVDRLVRAADERRLLGVRANADTPADAERARRFGAEGIGLCRTEHMFLGERRRIVERLILADTDAERFAALEELLPLQRNDFSGILTAMEGSPVTVRLLDPPLHEFLPDLTQLSVRVAVAQATGQDCIEEMRLLAAVHRLHEQNPMFGMRGVRLGIQAPGLFAMQARALFEAAAERRREGGTSTIEVMIPLVNTVTEFDLVRAEIDRVADQVRTRTGVQFDYRVGTMIELPRACMTAGAIARSAQFFSFGTNDLTQTTWGFSRDDVEAAFFPAYLEHGIFAVSPFESLDVEGVGQLVRMACEAGRASRPELKLGVCGEHAGDPRSVHFFAEVGLDYVSCSPFQLPVARLEAGRAAVMSGAGGESASR